MKRTVTILAILSLLAACTPEGGIGSPKDGPAYTAIMLDEGVPDDPKIDLCWTAGDMISVFRYSGWNEQYQLRGDDGYLDGRFEKVGEAPASVTGKSKALEASYAIYPWSSKTTCAEEGVFKVDYPSKQDFTSPRMAEGYSTMVAATTSLEDNDLKFKNVCGYLKISVHGVARVKYITIKGNDGEKISGFAKISISAGEDPEIEMCDDAEETITLNAGSLKIKDDKENPSPFYFTMPPTEFKNGLTITFEDADKNTYVKEIEGPISVKSGKVTEIEPFEYLAKIGEIDGTIIHSGYTIVGKVTDTAGNKLSGIPVSDGYAIVLTDENGIYQLKACEYSRYVFYILPAEYEIPLDSNRYPAFFSLNVKNGEISRNDFVLTPRTKDETNWTLVGISDPQVTGSGDMDRYQKETLADIRQFLADESKKNCYSIVLGDIVGASPGCYPRMKQMMSNFALNDGSYMPFFMVPGNHDHYKSGAKTQYESLSDYIGYFGPTEYSFNIGKAHVLVMDTHIAINWTGSGGGGYTCGITDAQWEWLQKDLALVENKEDKLLIFCTHASFGNKDAYANNVYKIHHKEDMLQAFRAFHDTHLFSGHTHYWKNDVFTSYTCKSGRPIYEHNEGAACGWMWDTSSINTDGSPNSYAVFDVVGNEIHDWIAKATGFPKEYQMRVYNGNQIYTDVSGNDYCWYNKDKCTKSTAKSYTQANFENSFVITLWGDDNTYWTVELYVGGVKVGDATRVTSSATDMCAQAFMPQTAQKSSLFEQCKYVDHYWWIKAPNNDPSTLKNWEIRATQTIPGTSTKHVYTCNSLQTDFTGM